MDDETMWATDRVIAPTLGSAITILETANEFAIKGNHLTRVKGNQFDGRIKTDPHKHIHEFLRIRDMFKYRDTKIKVVRLMMFPLSLTREAKTWLDELNEGTIEMWDELQANFISQFFPQLFSINSSEKSKPFPNMKNKFLTDAWLPQEVLNATSGGIFLYKTPNQAYQLLEDKVAVVLKLKKMARMDAMTMKMDAQYKEFQSRSKQLNLDHNDDDIPMSREEEAKFMQSFHHTRFYNDYRDSDSNRDNWRSSGKKQLQARQLSI
ncbi:hypothetical protein Tco_0253081 [Tanacetum coccineum]